MGKKDDRSEQAAGLRRRAEEIARERFAPLADDLAALSPYEIQQALQELRVYQIELELQNEELLRAHADLDAARARYFSDITARKQREESAQANDALLAMAGRTAQFGGWSARLAENRVLWSDEVAAIHDKPPGYSPSVEEGIGFYAPEWRVKIGEVFGACAREGKPFDEEMEIITAQGRRVWVRAMGEAIREESGAITRVQGAFQDITERKRAEEALHRARDRAQGYLDTVETIIVALSAEGRITTINRMGCRLFGCREEELLGQHWFSTCLPQPDGIKNVYPVFLKLMAGEIDAAEYFENSIVTKSGELRQIAWHNALLRDEQGRIIGTLSSGEDVTEHMRMEEALRESEGRYKRITEGLTDYQYTVRTEDGRAVETVHSPACATVTGYAAEEFAADPDLWLRMIAPEDRQRVQECVQQVLAGNEIEPLEHRIVRKDGEARWVRDTLILNKDVSGTLRSYDGVIKDITQHKQADEALRAALHYARNLIETSLDPLVTISAEGKITDVNAATESITGISRERLIGSDFSDYFTEPEIARAGYLMAFEQGQVIDYPLTVRHISGAITDVLYNASIYRNDQGEILGVFAAARDITARKRAEAEKENLEALNRQLQKSESLGRMAGAIAHHFNNQLQAVSLNLEMAMGELPLAAGSAAEFLADALQAARQASEVSGLMLTYLGQTIVSHAPLELSETCRRNLPMLLAAMPKSVALETDLPSPGPVVRANVNQMQQVLTNLITNAWEAGGIAPCVIRLSVKKVLSSEIPEGHRFPIDWQPRHDAYACLEVADTGCGIAYADIEKIFDPFFSSKFTGRGMGLAVVLGIVRAHEGVITAESDVGRGSTFRVYLPMTGKTGDATLFP